MTKCIKKIVVKNTKLNFLCANFIIKGTSKNSSSVRADQRDPLQQLEWMGPKATPGPIFRGALKVFQEGFLLEVCLQKC
jgi:hypothetical protein